MSSGNLPTNLLGVAISKLMKGEILPEGLLIDICNLLTERYLFTPNLVHVKSPVTVVGSVHAQFYDLLEMFRVTGQAPDVNFVFLGDYINRGGYGVETLSLLLCLQLRYPERVTLLRGNHESRTMTLVHEFYSECIIRYGTSNVWKAFTKLFDHLPIAAVIDNSFFCVHGGISPQVATLNQIVVFDRFMEIPGEGPLSEMVWSDPSEERGFHQSQRGVGVTFGPDIIAQFMKINRLSHIVRSHQLCLDGYQVNDDETLSTVWSAPNYLGTCANVAAVVEVDDQLVRNYNTFLEAPSRARASLGKKYHPYPKYLRST